MIQEILPEPLYTIIKFWLYDPKDPDALKAKSDLAKEAKS